MATIELRSVCKSFGNVEVIRNANITVADNEFVIFVGPSGCGKSTLLRLLSGLEELTSGEIYIDGERIDHMPPAQRGIAMVFQSYALYPHMTVAENMGYSLRVARQSKDEIARKVQKAAEILQLTELLDRKPKALSGGQRQRVAIGRAIVRDPKVFLFDEPLSNLDAKLRVQMRIELSNLHRSLKSTMIYVTHDQIEAMTMADKIVVLRNGVVEQVGAPLDLYYRPDNVFVAGFIGSPAMNFFPGRVVQVAGKQLTAAFEDDVDVTFTCATPQTLAVGESVTLGVRPEHFDVGEEGEAGFGGDVHAVERLGGETYVYLHTPSGKEILVHAAGDRAVNAGDNVKISFTLGQAHLFGPDEKAIRLDAEHAQ